MRKWYSLLALAFALSTQATVHQVTTPGTTFSPANLTITAGDTVQWTIGSTHNVNGDVGTFPNNPASFGSGAVGAVTTYSFQFTVPGFYNYQCDPHVGGGMVGTINVNAAPCTDLFISEYIEGSSNNKALEIYNPTGSTIDLSGYSLIAYNNGGTTPSNTLNMAGMLAPGDVYVVSNASADASVLAVADTTSTVTFYNGDDAIVLFHGTDTLDIIGIVGVDPGSSWPVGTGATGEYTLVRSATVTGGTTDWAVGATEWDVYPQNTFTYIGSHTATGCAIVPPPAGSAIADWTTEDPTTGVADSLGLTTTLTGTVFSVDFDGNAGYSFYMHDGTAGINVYNSADVDGYQVTLGDEIEVRGAIDQYNGLIEIVADSIYLVSSGNAVQSPAATSVLDESTESELVQLMNVTLVTPSQWPASGSSANVDVTDGTNTFLVRIDNDTDIDGSPAPTGPFNIIGVGSQFDNSNPYTGGYQLLPRMLTDISASQVSGTIADWTTEDPATGVADSLGLTATLMGTVFTIDFDGNAGYSFYMHDGTAGINVYNSADVDGYQLTMGDLIYVRGTIDQYNGLTELIVDSIHLVSQGNPLPANNVVTVLDETTESEYIRLNNLTLVTPSQWPAAGSSANVDITDGTNTYLMRIDNDTDVDGSPAPTGPFDLIGVGSQFDSSNPYTSGYQIFPRMLTDIIPVVVSTPTVSFVGSSVTVQENSGTTTISLQISPVSANPETITLTVVPGAGVTAGDGIITPAPNMVTGEIVLNIPAGADSTGITIQVIDDTDQESTENIDINITSVSAGLATGVPASYTFSVEDNDTPIPTYTIAQIHGEDPVTFEPDSLGVYCKLVGTVFTIDYDGNAGYSFYIHDGTAGINIFNFADVPSGYQSTEGDMIRAVGTLLFYNGLLELQVDSIAFISAGNPQTTPTVVTTLDESTESELVRINGLSLVDPAQWPAAGASTNVDVTDGVNTFVMRIDSDTDIDGTPPIGGTFDAIGVGNQFDNSSPYDANYQFFPRSLNDFILPPPPALAVTEIMPSSNDPVGNMQGDWFEIYNYGNTPIDLEGFSFDDNSTLAGLYVLPSFVLQPNQAVVIWDGLAADKANFISNWMLVPSTVAIIAQDELTTTIGFPGLSAGGDAVALFDTTGTLLCEAEYTSSTPGFSIEFDTLCTYLGNSTTGVNGATMSIGGDVGSPGNGVSAFGIDENALENFNLYPNPSSGLVTVSLATGGKRTVRVLNSLGQQVLTQERYEAEFSVDLSALPKGMYLIRIEADASQATRSLILH